MCHAISYVDVIYLMLHKPYIIHSLGMPSGGRLGCLLLFYIIYYKQHRYRDVTNQINNLI